MSASPARPRRPDSVLERVLELRVGDRRRGAAATARSPGSTLPDARRHHQALERREAHRRVDADGRRAPRPATRPAPRWQVTTAAARPPRRAPRGVGVGEAVEAVAPQRPALAPLRAAARRSRPRPAASRGRPCRSRRPRARRAAHGRRRRCRPARRAGAGARARRARPARRRRRRRRSTASRKRAPPCTTRWPDRVRRAAVRRARLLERRAVGRRAGRVRPRAASSGPSRRSLRLLEPALTTRTRTSAVGRPVRPGPVADLGRVLAVLARVRAVAQALVDHLLAQVRGARRRARARGR